MRNFLLIFLLGVLSISSYAGTTTIDNDFSEKGDARHPFLAVGHDETNVWFIGAYGMAAPKTVNGITTFWGKIYQTKATPGQSKGRQAEVVLSVDCVKKLERHVVADYTVAANAPTLRYFSSVDDLMKELNSLPLKPFETGTYLADIIHYGCTFNQRNDLPIPSDDGNGTSL